MSDIFILSSPAACPWLYQHGWVCVDRPQMSLRYKLSWGLLLGLWNGNRLFFKSPFDYQRHLWTFYNSNMTTEILTKNVNEHVSCFAVWMYCWRWVSIGKNNVCCVRFSPQCYTIHGLELSRVTVVNCNLQVVYDAFVRPDYEVIDYNTR